MFALSNAEHAALGTLFHDNHVHGRRGMDDLPKIHLVDIADGNRQHPVTASIRAGHPKPAIDTVTGFNVHGLMQFRRMAA